MEVNKQIIIRLTELESDAVKTLIGKTSENDRLELGLSRDQSALVSELYDLLPCLEED